MKGKLRRVQFMVMALIAPELVVVWAMRQWLVAHRLAQKYKGVFISFVIIIIRMLMSVKIINGRRLMVSLPS